MKQSETRDTQTAARLAAWKKRLQKARAAYEDELAAMRRREEVYGGSHLVEGAAKRSSNVRNIAFELVESQVDASLPLPKVTAVHEEDAPLARRIEALLRGEMERLHLDELNDRQERTVPIQGGSFWQVEWNAEGGTHCTLGELNVSELHPRQVIPQPGVYEPDEMDYLFVCATETREAVERRYGVKLEPATEEDPTVRTDGEDAPSEELVTVYIAYFRNRQGGVGRFIWAEDTVLEESEDYQARQQEVCAVCGRARNACECGSQRFVRRAVEWETAPPERFGGQTVQLHSYTPRQLPLLLRRNVSRAGSLLGCSDIDLIRDQQEAIKKLGGKLDEKILKGGSYVTLPQGVGVETTDRELKIIRLKTPAEKALIDVLNVQPDIAKERAVLEDNYGWAKSTLGITDSFQGKYDGSAVSGTARQFSANQAAGRLESKRRMKNAAYARLFRVMFHFMLAYADQPLPIRSRDAGGSVEYGHFDRWDFVKQDAAGEWYWNDEFLFSVDTSATMSANREAMWAETRNNFQLGAFGAVNTVEAQLAYWTTLERYAYPGAADIKSMLERRQPQTEPGGETNAMPLMRP